MKILAIIPARGGSRGIKNKNIRMFGGNPLLAHAIEQAKRCKYINRIIVSTDSINISKIAKKYGAEVPFLRPKNLAQDNSNVADAIYHLLKKLSSAYNYKPDVLVILQVTSPLRMVDDITGALELFLSQKKADSVVTVCDTEQLLFTLNSRRILELVSDHKFLKSANRQELTPTYRLDGPMVEIIRTGVFLKNKGFLPKKTLGYVIPNWRAIDIDHPQDFVIGEIIYKNYNKIIEKIKKFK